MKLPERRPWGCLLLTKEDGWALRELIKPFDAALELREAQIALVRRLYEALLRLHILDLEACGVSVSIEDCLIINQNVKSGAWKGADALLLQTWQVMHELTEGQPLRSMAFRVEEYAIYQSGATPEPQSDDSRPNHTD